MSGRIRIAFALLVLVAFTCGSLSALPLGPRSAPAEESRGNLLTAIWDWIAAIFVLEAPTGGGPEPALVKSGPSMDPNGGP